MQAFEINHLIAQCQQGSAPYLEFLRVPSMSTGIYMLPTGSVDSQQPHTEDEVYYIVKGHAFIKVEEESREVQAGSIIFVSANVEHRFYSITEDLVVLVFFAPAEYSQA